MRARLLVCASVVAAVWSHDVATAHAECSLRTDKDVVAAYKAKTGHELANCIRRSKTFPGVTTVAWSQSAEDDDDCSPLGVFVGCDWKPVDGAKRAMTAAGWARGDVTARTALALAWLTEVELIRPIAAAPTDFGDSGKKFTTPAAALTPKPKTFTLELWTLHKTSRCRVEYRKLKFVFDADGVHADPEKLDDATVELECAT